MSKPKEIRICAFCNEKMHKSKLLKINLPNITFDVWQNINSRSFYVCYKKRCIENVLKKKVVNRHISNNFNFLLYKHVVKNNIIDKIKYEINLLFKKNGCMLKDIIDNYKILLKRYDVIDSIENSILVNNEIYSGRWDVCPIYNNYTAKLIMEYKNIIIKLDGFE